MKVRLTTWGGNVELLAVVRGKGYFAVVMLEAVVETEGNQGFVPLKRIV